MTYVEGNIFLQPPNNARLSLTHSVPHLLGQSVNHLPTDTITPPRFCSLIHSVSQPFILPSTDTHSPAHLLSSTQPLGLFPPVHKKHHEKQPFWTLYTPATSGGAHPGCNPPPPSPQFNPFTHLVSSHLQGGSLKAVLPSDVDASTSGTGFWQ